MFNNMFNQNINYMNKLYKNKLNLIVIIEINV